jgi:DNA-binding MarR family transcriptional regulator
MKNVVGEFKQYFKDVLGITVEITIWQDSNLLPFILRDAYTFYTARFLDTLYLLFLAQNDKEQTPAVISKHLSLIEGKWNGDIIYVNESISSYNRGRLIEHKVPFVVPGNQMYLLPLGVDFREHFRKIRTIKHKFSPSTQAVVIYAFQKKEQFIYSQSELAKILSYTQMTINRAFDELESLGLSEIITKGRERVLQFENSKKNLWDKSREYFRSPVKRKIFIKPIKNDSFLISAGLTALAHYSMLAPPVTPAFAMSSEELKVLRVNNTIIELENSDTDSFEIEIWIYSPQILAKSGLADKFSLYCSLMDSKDERIESALDEMMESIQW